MDCGKNYKKLLILLKQYSNMSDMFTKKQRSYIMSRIRSKWTSQEKIVHNYLKGNKIKHQMHPAIIGSPDILIKGKNIVVFLHGCFWHKCKKHYIAPKSRKGYWVNKINNNVKRDKKNVASLKKQGYTVLTIWEHDIKNKRFLRILV